MWKLLDGRVRGTSHEQSGQPCQDYALGRVMRAGEDTVLVVTCADGAGSAAHSETGAKVACETILGLVGAALDGGLSVKKIVKETVLTWHQEVRGRLEVEAAARNALLREFACTLLLAVIGEKCAAFSQLGDGAIITDDGEGYRSVFWPQSGEYANMTFFLTDRQFEERVAFISREGAVEEVALLTDGLEMLALNFAEKKVHAPFFAPMFKTLRETADVESLKTPMRDFLTSPKVNERTDDDKTLFLATRRPGYGTSATA